MPSTAWAAGRGSAATGRISRATRTRPSNGNLLIHSDNLSKLTPKQLEYVSLMTPLTNSDGRAIDLLQNEMPETYVVEHDSAAGRWNDVILFNWDDQSVDKILDLEVLDFPVNAPLHMFDFWDRCYSSIINGTLTCKQVPPHGCKLLRFVQANNTPCLVGDTLHLSQGAEIAVLQTNEKQLTLITIDMKRKASGELWFWLPQKPTKAECNDLDTMITEVEQNTYKVAMEFVNVGSLKIYW
jgi:hypothetical protein